MERADCNECLHACVCKYKDDVMETLQEAIESPTRYFGEVGQPVASINQDLWVDCNYFDCGIK